MNKTIISFIVIFFLQIVSSAQLSPSAQSNFRIAVDGDAPIINIISPKNTIYNNQTPLLVNYTVFDPTLDSIWYSLNSQNNISLFSLFYLNLPEGSYNLTIYANDSFNRVNFSEVSFKINNSASFCGDSICSSGEDCNSCSTDCGSCIPTPGAGGGGGGGGFPKKSNISSINETPEEKPKTTPVQNESEKPAEQNITEITPIKARFTYTYLIIILIILLILIILILLYYKHKRLKTNKKVKQIGLKWKKKKSQN